MIQTSEPDEWGYASFTDSYGRHVRRPVTARPAGGLTIIPDIQPFRTQEGAVIGSRKDLRAYEQANGVRQIGNDWPGSERPRFWDRVERRNKERA